MKSFNEKKESGFRFEDNVWEKIDLKDGIEMWTTDFNYLYSHGGLRSITSYSFKELISTNWHQLFIRDAIHVKQIERAAYQMIQSSSTVENVCGEHVVKECIEGHNVTALVKVKLLSPIFSTDSGLLVGGLAVTSVKRLFQA